MRMPRFDINGILLLDKPLGLSSNSALQKVKNLFQAKKAGHTGSLDPLATGMLPICFGEATKFSQYLLDSDKKYCVTMQLGIRTTTSDAEGEIVATRAVPYFSIQDIDKAFDTFRGNISQVPSMYSALKYHGKPLYYLARQGITVERQSRTIAIYDLKIISFKDNCVCFTVHCSKGTYVRTLVDDVGEKLNCGAHVTQLRRLSVGEYLENKMITLEALQQESDLKKHLISIETIVTHLPEAVLTSTMIFYLKQGQSVFLSAIPPSGFIRLLDSAKKFVGIGESIDGKIAPRRILQ
ncbi:MAG: hypothetical protein ACD_29C00031G0006 [uncultured bacterium]|nr:MAG: hypothetical protein ACD_29C00031G0006 [uncultured bacterium]